MSAPNDCSTENDQLTKYVLLRHYKLMTYDSEAKCNWWNDSYLHIGIAAAIPLWFPWNTYNATKCGDISWGMFRRFLRLSRNPWKLDGWESTVSDKQITKIAKLALSFTFNDAIFECNWSSASTFAVFIRENVVKCPSPLKIIWFRGDRLFNSRIFITKSVLLLRNASIKVQLVKRKRSFVMR